MPSSACRPRRNSFPPWGMIRAGRLGGALRSCPAGLLAEVGLRWCGARPSSPNGGSQCQSLRRSGYPHNLHRPRRLASRHQWPRLSCSGVARAATGASSGYCFLWHDCRYTDHDGSIGRRWATCGTCLQEADRGDNDWRSRDACCERLRHSRRLCLRGIARRRLRSGPLVPFVYRCPATGLNVQGFFADEVPAKETDIYEPVTCTACTRVHLVNRSTGKTLHEYDE
jgi:hypothetical protein